MRKQYFQLIRRSRRIEREYGMWVADKWFNLQFHVLLNFNKELQTYETRKPNLQESP